MHEQFSATDKRPVSAKSGGLLFVLMADRHSASACARAAALTGAAAGAVPGDLILKSKNGSSTGLTIRRELRSREAVKLRRSEAIRADEGFE